MLQQLLDTSQQQPERPLELPTDNQELFEIFDKLRKAIVQNTDQSQLDEAEILNNLAKKISEQTGDADHIALANWCNGLFFLNRDVLCSAKSLKEAADYFQCMGEKELEGRVLIGYAGQISHLGQFKEAEDIIAHSIECLKMLPDYPDWPIIYLNQSYLFLVQNRYQEAIRATELAEKSAITLKKKIQKMRTATQYNISRA